MRGEDVCRLTVLCDWKVQAASWAVTARVIEWELLEQEEKAVYDVIHNGSNHSLGRDLIMHHIHMSGSFTRPSVTNPVLCCSL